MKDNLLSLHVLHKWMTKEHKLCRLYFQKKLFFLTHPYEGVKKISK